METLAPTFAVSADLDRSEVHYTASGLWDMPTMLEFQRELLSKSKPLLDREAKIYSLGDLRGFVTQVREVSDAMRVVILESAKLGVVKSAIISDNVLARMQFMRLNEGINIEVFENKADAINWLRASD
ncbi:MAG: hypothetical protein AAFR64_08545 [Pseudomonadota bacterium]